jgi:hypothetical protein
MIDELEDVVLTFDLPKHGLAKGDIGTVVLCIGGEGYEVEFTTLDGEAIAIATLMAEQVRPSEPREIAHVRIWPRISNGRISCAVSGYFVVSVSSQRSLVPNINRLTMADQSNQLVQKRWLRDESLEESDNLPDPDVLAQEIIEDLEAALEQFREIAADLGGEQASAESHR